MINLLRFAFSFGFAHGHGILGQADKDTLKAFYNTQDRPYYPDTYLYFGFGR